MLVRKFEAEDMAAALKQVKETLGADALILSTRTLRKKGLGVLGKQTIEVTAAIESPAMKASANKAVEPKTVSQDLGRVALHKRIPAAYRGGIELREDEPLTVPPPRQSPQPVELRTNPLEAEVQNLRAQLESQDVGALKSELEQLKGMIKQMAAAPSHRPASAAPRQFGGAASGWQSLAAAQQHSQPSHELEVLTCLLERGIASGVATAIARQVAERVAALPQQSPERCHELLTNTLAEWAQTSGPIWQPGEAQKKIALIGPTGVGKTTTIAKLAATAITRSGARVALVTIDTYRIAAVEQLKVYGDIMGLPVEVVITPDQLQEAFARHRDKDLILIDTAGRSPRDQIKVAELAEFLGDDEQIENCLVLAAPTDERIQQQTLEAFQVLPISRLIYTKLDETDSCGALINLPSRTNLPLAYLTNGQQVPEDLLLAEPTTVAELVLGDVSDPRRMVV